jgi:hypothetical protein
MNPKCAVHDTVARNDGWQLFRRVRATLPWNWSRSFWSEDCDS